MKKTVLLIASLLSMAVSSQAKPVDLTEAHRVAVNFWNSHRPIEVKPVSEMETRTFAGLDHLFVFTSETDGFVIVSADDCVIPVLAYAFDAPFPEELHPALSYWLGGYESQIAEAVKSDYVPTDNVASQWNTLLSNPVPATPVSLTTVPALIATRWDQGDPYNQYCPYDSIRECRAVVGCVATAMAQIMKYWNYPAFGQGAFTYTYRGKRISADFGSTTYIWQHMPTFLFEGSFSYQKDAVALLSYHCGVSVSMMYGCSAQGGSGAYSHNVLSAMTDFFKYDPSLRAADRYRYSDSAWCALLDSELDGGRPVYYTGSDSTSGHAFILDGSDTAQRYHFNWGWSGYGNGFYSINNLAPGTNNQAGGNATYTFNLGQDVILGIKPGMVEVFDTVDYYDSICSDTRYIQFREYTLRVEEMDTFLVHLDTVFNYHLKVINQKHIVLEPNGGTGESRYINYCPATGIVLPGCDFTKTNCRFVGWCNRRNGEGDTVQPGTHVMLNSNRRYYALWQDTTVSIGDVHEASTIKFWPNPTTGEISISLPVHTGTILVIDALGRTVLREDYPNIMGGTAKISLSALPNGAYNVLVKTDRGVYNQRIIKY